MSTDRDTMDKRIADLEHRLAEASGSPDAAGLAGELGMLLVARFTTYQTPAADRDRAIILLEQFLTAPVGERAVTRAALGLMLFLRAPPMQLGPDPDGTALMMFVTGLMSGAFNAPAQLADRERAAEYLREFAADESVELPVRRHAQGMIAVLRVMEASGPAALMQAVMSLAEVAGELGQQQQTLTKALLATVAPAEPQQLDEALREVLPLLPEGHRLQPLIVAELGVLLGERGHVGSLPDRLVETSTLLHDALDTVRDDDEALTLAIAFLAAGAGSVVGSRWAVDDCTTACLMVMFHRYRAAGLRDRDALRAAQRWMLDPDRDVPPEVEPLCMPVRASLADPAAWAPFAHHGR